MNVATFAFLTSCIAAISLVSAFFMRVPIRLRQISLITNVTLVFALGYYHLWATCVANAILIPLNLWRLRELFATRAAVRAAMATTDLSWDWIRPFMTRRRVAGGQIVFRKGDVADELFFILDGTAHLEELDVDISIGVLFGEIAMFSPERRRMSTAIAKSDLTLLSIGGEALAEMYEKNPQFGVYIVRLITQRLLEDLERAHAAIVREDEVALGERAAGT